MNQELLIRRLKAALDVAPADPALRARVISSLPLDRRQARNPRLAWAGVVAALLMIATIAGLLYLGPLRPAHRTQTATIPLSDCKLPVYGQATYQPGQKTIYEEGFLDLSDGSFSPASPASTTEVDHLRALPSGGGISYDRAFDLWLPVPFSWIAPDGMSYAYLSSQQSTTTDVHVRDLRTQSDRVLVHSKVVRLVGWVGSRLYYASGEGYNWGLWVVDPSSGQDRQLDPPSPKEWWSVGPDAVWGSRWYTGSLSRYDIGTGTITLWNLDRMMDIIGVDSAGHPLVLVRAEGADLPMPPEGELMLMPASNQAVTIGKKGELLPLQTVVIPDGDRTWFSATGQRMWVYSPDTGLVFLDQTSNTSLPNGAVIAGGCV